MFFIIWREAKHWLKLFRRLVCCGSIYTPEARNVNMRVCRHHTTWGESEQTKALFIRIHLWLTQPNRNRLNSILPYWPFMISNQSRRLTSLSTGTKHCHVAMETVYEDLAASFERWSGRRAFSVCGSTALSMLHCLPLCCSRPFSPLSLKQTSIL